MGKLRVTRKVAEELEKGLQSGEDVGAMLARLKVGPELYRRWLNSPGLLGRLAARALSEDLQTALVVSRYRPLAASRLGEMALREGGGEAARRACVDLLRVDLSRAAADLADVVADGKGKRPRRGASDDPDAALRALRALRPRSEEAKSHGKEA